MTIGSVLKHAAKNVKGHRIADGELEMTYVDLYEYSLAFSHYLASRGVKRGSLVAAILPNSIEYLISYFASHLIGAIYVPIHPGAAPAEVQSTIEYVGASVTLGTARTLRAVPATVDAVEVTRESVTLGAVSTWQWTAHKSQSDPFSDAVSADDVALLLHTSGTTSNPKRVALQHHALVRNAIAHADSIGLTGDDVGLILLPMSFGYCNTAQILAHIVTGGRIVIGPTPALPVDVLAYISRYRVTTFTAVPTMLKLLHDKGPSGIDTSSLRSICFGGGVMSKALIQRVMHQFPQVDLIQTYGMTEAAPRLTTWRSKVAPDKIGSVGLPISGVDIRVIANDGSPVPLGVVGNIVAKTPTVMGGYFKRPDETARVLKAGWLHTGDLGFFDRDGYLYLMGRTKNVIISGGNNIYPEEIEETLMRHPGVAECVVTGEPDELLGERVVALVVPYADSAPAAEDLRTYLRQKMASFKVPQRVDFRDDLPKTVTGKIRRYQSSVEGRLPE